MTLREFIEGRADHCYIQVMYTWWYKGESYRIRPISDYQVDEEYSTEGPKQAVMEHLEKVLPEVLEYEIDVDMNPEVSMIEVEIGEESEYSSLIYIHNTRA